MVQAVDRRCSECYKLCRQGVEGADRRAGVGGHPRGLAFCPGGVCIEQGRVQRRGCAWMGWTCERSSGVSLGG